jgi:hypothetical protein
VTLSYPIVLVLVVVVVLGCFPCNISKIERLFPFLDESPRGWRFQRVYFYSFAIFHDEVK